MTRIQDVNELCVAPQVMTDPKTELRQMEKISLHGGKYHDFLQIEGQFYIFSRLELIPCSTCHSTGT